ncbi:zinc-ribbon domain containing protein [Oscillochloris sp. ZM17-4]|uniref:zinc-ribbon domain containing protein n=1 Tax=Oscillochloris sp. ZM17-4 TaxID=2866714 RepID=UPI001C7327F6|nr:zinc-ribbon domain containing protein [Oscillochloris sp. ZM17-4]MBX0327834.1 zinc-ribbon domain containing protein [Oscillochloris sp. ZM17-4]
MSFADKTLTCRDCGMDFVFTAGEQEFYASKGFVNEPTRCPSCRQNRKAQAGSGGPRDDRAPRSSSFAPGAPRERVSYKVTCANCGQETTVPFVPRGTKPVYCSDCFDQMRGGSAGGGGGSRPRY